MTLVDPCSVVSASSAGASTGGREEAGVTAASSSIVVILVTASLYLARSLAPEIEIGRMASQTSNGSQRSV